VLAFSSPIEPSVSSATQETPIRFRCSCHLRRDPPVHELIETTIGDSRALLSVPTVRDNHDPGQWPPELESLGYTWEQPNSFSSNLAQTSAKLHGSNAAETLLRQQPSELDVVVSGM